MKNVVIAILCGITFNQYLLGTWFQNFVGISFTLCVGLFILDYVIDDIRSEMKRRKRLAKHIQELRYEKIM